MSIGVHTWKRSEEEALRNEFAGVPFLSYDPGANGGLVGWDEHHNPVTSHTYKSVEHSAWQAARLMSVSGFRLLVLESQYVGRNIDTALTTSRRAGIFVGAYAMCLAHVTGDESLDTVWVKPAVWQRHCLGRTGRQMERKALKEIALKEATAAVPLWFKGLRKPEMEGLADAYCIGHGWRNLWAAR